MNEKGNLHDSYEKEQHRLWDLYENLSSDEDPYVDSSGEYGSDENYVPSETSSTRSAESQMSDADDLPVKATKRSKTNPTKRVQPGTLIQGTSGVASAPQHKNTLQNEGISKNSRDAYFRPVSFHEMKKCFALCLLQGQISTSNMRRFFSYADILYFRPLFSYVMSGRRLNKYCEFYNVLLLSQRKKKKLNQFLQFLRAQNISDGIRIFSATEADYRSITKFFSNDPIPYHTYQLPSEKLLNVAEEFQSK
ncbi:hypothetical protein QE152_g31363 [Popillia japonica]|uniref:Uncharacterized protein n=1 Tax=Popillia japonica TaxID=7064 RepID=A0AAW1J1L0_POPJA